MSEPLRVATDILQPPVPAPRFRWRTLAALIFVLAVGAFLSLYDLRFEPHFDELWHLALSTGRGSAHLTMPRDVLIPSAPSVTGTIDAPPVSVIPSSLRTVTHPPLYPMLLRVWRDVAGDSLSAARALSGVFFVTSILLLFDSVRRLHDVQTAFWAALLLAVSSAQLQTAQQVRNYSFEVMCVAWVVQAVICIQIGGASMWRLIWLMLATLAALFSHYFAAFALAGIGVYALMVLRQKTRVAVASTLLIALVMFVVIWSPMLRAQRDAIDDATYRSPLSTIGEPALHDGLLRVCLAPMRLLFEPRPYNAIAPRFSGILLLLPWLLVWRRPKLLLWALIFDGVIGSVFAMDIVRQTKHLGQIRHVLVAGIGLSALIPAMLEGDRAWLRHGVPALIILACVAALGLPIQDEFRHYEMIGHAVSDSRYRSEPIIFYGDPDALWKSDVNYMAASQFSDTFPRPVVRLSRPLDAQLLAQLQRWPGALLVCEHWQLDSPDIQQNAKVEMLGVDPYLADVAHLTWMNPLPTSRSTTQPTEASARQ